MNPGAADGGTFGDGNNRLIFATNRGFGLGNFITGIQFDGFAAHAVEVQFGTGRFEIVPVPEPAPSPLIRSVALCALIGLRALRRLTGIRSDKN